MNTSIVFGNENDDDDDISVGGDGDYDDTYNDNDGHDSVIIVISMLIIMAVMMMARRLLIGYLTGPFTCMFQTNHAWYWLVQKYVKFSGLPHRAFFSQLEQGEN